jgi:putative inorganic carbon (HCO3(-)) transporter
MKGFIITYVATYGGAFVGLFDPFVGLLIYVAFAILRPESLWSYSVPEGGNYSRIIGIAILVGWALRGFGNWSFGHGRGVVLALLSYWLFFALSAVFAENTELSIHLLVEISKVFLPFLLGITLTDSVQKLKALAWVIALSHAFLAYEFNLSYYSGFNSVTEGGFASLDNNGIAMGMASAAGLTFFLGLHSKLWWQKGIAFVGAALMTNVVFFSNSRGGMLALFATGLVSFVMLAKEPKYYVVFLIAGALMVRLAGKEARERLATSWASEEERDASAQSRLDLWSATWKVMWENPVLGIGPGHWQLESHEHGFVRNKAVHNTWLEVGVEMGVPSLVSLMLFYGICAVRLWWVAWRPDAPFDFVTLARPTIASIFAFCAAGIFLSAQGLEAPYYVTLIGACVLKLDSQRGSDPSLRPKRGAGARQFLPVPNAPTLQA